MTTDLQTVRSQRAHRSEPALAPWTLVQEPSYSVPRGWANAFASEHAVAHRFPPAGIDPREATVIGGICSLFAGDAEMIRKKEVRFAGVADFAAWVDTWYPRCDQVWNTVGVPPEGVKKVVYVVEDSIFARRIAGWTGLAAADLQRVLRVVHMARGEQAVRDHLQRHGWAGELVPVYTSAIEREHAVALRIWERCMGRSFPERDREMALVALMYTGFWSDVLGLREPVVLYEPDDHMSFPEGAPSWMRQWFMDNPYGSAGVNSNLGILGYRGFHKSGRPTRQLPHWQLR